ncbi:hypothetical protein CEE60_05885 [Stenotrophomonas maltophilia]|uniref:Uncharacterized protein n=1 Tax=Stenotrophomonas maltophilia TaxID=40324 RepID=A0A246HP16_STEMA|nr:hypothetical protein [Stenotrophomonas maltophilia]OWQ55082.1 hypothetical protein CEE60_05885 [Stenotrophomonas maltophilia]
MTQRHISHPEPLPDCAAGHSARHIHDLRSLAAGGGHFVECRCRHTRKHAEPDAAIAEWRRVNRPPRAARKTAAPEDANNVVQLLMPLREAGAAAAQRRAHGRR